VKTAVAIAALVLLGVAAKPGGKLVQQGDALYGQYCLSCHRANGVGTSTPRTIGAAQQRNQQQQQVVAPSLRGVGALAADFYLRTGYMPLHRVGLQPRRSRVLFTDAQIHALIAYVASLGKGPAIPTPHPQEGNLSAGLHLFTDHCAGCHQVVAQGGVVTEALPPPLESATDVQIAEAVRIGPYVMPRFSKRAISDRQLDSIVRYVDWAKHPDNRGGWGIGEIGPVPEGLVTWFIAVVVLIGLCLAIGKKLKHA
jgi:quinol---cytochrome-c reductase cytochrome c subunit